MGRPPFVFPLSAQQVKSMVGTKDWEIGQTSAGL